MTGYVKGTTAASELARAREAMSRASAAMQSDPDPVQAFRDATAAEELGRELSKEFSNWRAWYVSYLNVTRGMTQADIALALGISPGRVGQLVREGKRRGENPVTDPGTTPELAAVAVGIITSQRGVLIARRVDRRPEWTFPGGELLPGESPADAIRRRCTAETGLPIKPVTVFGRRVHPRTNRVMIYMACEVEGDSLNPSVGDPDDLDLVEWAGLDVVRTRMPDMYDPVKAHLEAVLGNMQVF